MAFLFPKLFPPYVGCLPETANGQFEMPLEDAMAFVWKARTIKFTASFVITSRFILSDFDPPETGTLINTLNANTTIFLTEDDEAPNPQPLEKMSDLICRNPYLVFQETATYVSGNLIGSFVSAADGGGGNSGQETWEFTPFEYSVGPLSVKTAGENKVCDFAYDILLVPGDASGKDAQFYVSTGGYYPPFRNEGRAIIPNGAVIKINGNTYSTDLYFNADVYSSVFTFTSVAATGQILIEIESERLAE
jgi:hypothetical protein